ncbi:unnamed protein product [Ranitomeya imitator]|uniref:Hflx-type G domain-containing protein n=1 Tax=Ranitomeya imitator TaxID=111125 RepID=A0ABN9LMU2_9NEOB|nr:unnamed protein product [Ranitomeya imitator]
MMTCGLARPHVIISRDRTSSSRETAMHGPDRREERERPALDPGADRRYSGNARDNTISEHVCSSLFATGETFIEVQQRLLKEREMRIKKALDKLRSKRKLLRTQRRRREFPIISVMGYTNSGKTTLIQALTGDTNLHPRNQLFATLDVTAHGGLLPCRMPVIYVDTIGFLSQLPHNLIESFSATLEDVIHSDLLIHVRDISHPEADNQKKSVLSVLQNLKVPQKLLETMIEVHNKIDLVEM